MRVLLVTALLALSAPAAAQQAAPESEAVRASRLLAADWRPVSPSQTSGAAITALCAGAADEMAILDARLPAELTPQALAEIRAPTGLVIIPTGDDPAAAYIFPNARLTAITPGAATIHVVSAATGRVNLIDAAGHETQVQLGGGEGRRMLRILRADGPPLTYVACVSTAG